MDYSNQAVYASNELWKFNNFMVGLRGEIEHIVAQHKFDACVEMMHQCYVVENSLKKIQAEKE